MINGKDKRVMIFTLEELDTAVLRIFVFLP